MGAALRVAGPTDAEPMEVESADVKPTEAEPNGAKLTEAAALAEAQRR
jgi:hypothetical protein